MNSTLSSAATSMQGVLHGSDRTFAGVSTDTRTVRSGELFFALSGPNFDGGEFVAEAAAKGAAGAVVAHRVNTALAQITVDDTRAALGRLGAAWRQQHAATIVGVTGSNGKTTLKEMIAACLAQTAATIATAGNLNNDIGMPLMLLRINASHRFAVIEMGANHVGEIAYLTSLAMPDVVVITNAGPSHLEGFGSLQGVAEGKGEILQGAQRPRCAVLNADDDFFDYWSSLAADIEVLSFGLDERAAVHASQVELDKAGSAFRLNLEGTAVDVRLPLAGLHNVRNACAAAAVATVLGVGADDIRAALESIVPVDGRLQPAPGRNGATLFDDSYNANPVSVAAAGEFLAALPGQSWMVLGDMGELGEDAEALHRQTGESLREMGIDRLFAVGELSKSTVAAFGHAGQWFGHMDELVDAVGAQLAPAVNVLVKGSRSARMERAVAGLRAPEPARMEA